MSARSGGYIHDALLYESDDVLVETAVTLFHEGVEAGEEPVLACTAPHNAAIVNAFGGEFPGRVVDGRESYGRPAETIVAYQRLTDEAVERGAPGIRVVADVGAERNPEEWLRYEAIVNHALAPYPIWGVCVYGAKDIAPDILEGVQETHPNVRVGATRSTNRRYVEPHEFLVNHTRVRSHPLEGESPDFEISRVISLSALRDGVQATAPHAGLPEQDVVDFAYAVNEVVTNALVHGRPPVRARLWARAGVLLATVVDAGDGFNDPLAGYAQKVRTPLNPGAGLSLVRRLCDQVDIYTTDEGFTVRLRTEDHA